MRVVILSKDSEDYSRVVTDFVRDFEHQTGHELEIIDPYSIEGVSFCEAYGLMGFPSIIALNDSGIMQNMWRGIPLPTISEVSYYVQ